MLISKMLQLSRRTGTDCRYPGAAWKANLDYFPAFLDLGIPPAIPYICRDDDFTDHGNLAAPEHESTRAMTGFPLPGPLPEGEGDQGIVARCFHGNLMAVG
ncbi:MAG: hypothetical protein ACRERV_07665 [Methylococcales bacterium]